MDVNAEPHVVRKIPAGMVEIFVDHDLVADPVPAVAVSDVRGRHAEVESAEPEAIRAAASEPPDVTGPEAATKVSVLPRMIQMIVAIVAWGMADPDIPVRSRVNVRRFRMSVLIGKIVAPTLRTDFRGGWRSLRGIGRAI